MNRTNCSTRAPRFGERGGRQPPQSGHSKTTSRSQYGPAWDPIPSQLRKIPFSEQQFFTAGVSATSPWQLAENRASADVSYAKGTCPHLDDLLSRAPLIASWPAIIREGWRTTGEVGHVMDFMPTFVDVAGARYPAIFHGRKPLPLEGKSLLPVFRNESRPGYQSPYWRVPQNAPVNGSSSSRSPPKRGNSTTSPMTARRQSIWLQNSPVSSKNLPMGGRLGPNAVAFNRNANDQANGTNMR